MSSTFAQHFTPLAAVDLTYDLVHGLYGPLHLPRIIDPACGEGIFLRRAIERGLTTPERAFGIERDPALARRAFARSGGPRAVVADALLALRSPAADGPFDLVVANPPFGTGAGGLRELDDEATRRLAGRYELLTGRSGRVRVYPAEVLFLELCVGLARPGGHVALILPEGLLANARYRYVREWLLSRFQLDAVVSLPDDTFHRAGALAKTALVLLTKQPPEAEHEVMLGEVGEWARGAGPSVADGATSCAAPPDGFRRRRQDEPGLLRRLDPGYWRPECDRLLAASRFPLASLGEYVVKLTYGPIVTGRRVPPASEGVAIVNQGQVRFCGVDLADAPLAPPDSPWVSPRAMLQPGDVVLPRSGEGSLGKHKVAVFLAEGRATVGSFVDLMRLQGLNPFYAAAFLKSRLGRVQVARIANGVGVPNISFEEIRELRIPRLPEAGQQAIEDRYRAEVLPLHEQAVARHAEVRQSGGAARRDPLLSELREVGERQWRWVIEDLDRELLGVFAGTEG